MKKRMRMLWRWRGSAKMCGGDAAKKKNTKQSGPEVAVRYFQFITRL